MQIFDFNIHLPDLSSPSTVDDLAQTEKDISLLDGAYRIRSLPNIKGVNIMIFNQDFGEHCELRNILSNKFENFSITQLIDPTTRSYNYQSIDCIKFHCYHQNITQKDYPNILKLCKQASGAGKSICLDTSYGGSKMYKNNPMELACHIADEIKNTPIILLHSGGLKCWEAFLLSTSQDNIFLETSFTVDYYWGSPLINDLKFIYHKLGADRIIFGSDMPYADHAKQVKQIRQLLNDIKFTDRDIEKIFYNNALTLLS
tara:strand:+ start:744 stop:1517 length:774 start_codon:yes stop_codon:yes gene_type:complete